MPYLTNGAATTAGPYEREYLRPRELRVLPVAHVSVCMWPERNGRWVMLASDE